MLIHDVNALPGQNYSGVFQTCISPTGCFTLKSESDTSYHVQVDGEAMFKDLPPVSTVSFGYSNGGKIEPNSCGEFTVCNRKISPFTPRRKLIDIITRISGKHVFKNPSSPQYKSLCWWLSDLDSMEETLQDNTALIQRYLLVLLYFSTDGDRWYNKNNWLQHGSECTWYGVSCYQGVVSTINLASNNLMGYLPSEIGEFVELNHLILDHNSLKGGLPVETVRLQLLNTLGLSYNFFNRIYSFRNQVPYQAERLGS